MVMTLERWEALRASLDYCCVRMSELEQPGAMDREEYETLVDHGLATAATLLHLANAPPLANARAREQWQVGYAEVMKTRERIFQASRALEP